MSLKPGDTVLADPLAVLDYEMGWSDWVQQGEVITASTWKVSPIGITMDPPGHPSTFTDDSATVWLSGGSLDVVYMITNHITTNQARQTERSFFVQIVDR